MANSPLLRWGLTLCVALLAFLVAYRLQRQTLASRATSSTYCYKSVRTHDSEKPSAQCFSVASGLFTNVWTKTESTSDSSLSNINGHVIPGLWDGHGHLLQYGEFLHSVDLFGSESIDDVKSRLRTYLDANKKDITVGTKDNWVRGIGWDQTFFGRMPTAVSRLS